MKLGNRCGVAFIVECGVAWRNPFLSAVFVRLDGVIRDPDMRFEGVVGGGGGSAIFSFRDTVFEHGDCGGCGRLFPDSTSRSLLYSLYFATIGRPICQFHPLSLSLQGQPVVKGTYRSPYSP